MKQFLRRKYKPLLASIEPCLIQKESEIVTDLVVNHSTYLNSQNISIFCSMGGEIDTTRLIQNMFENGKNVFVPRCRNSDMQMVFIKSFQDYISLPVNSWGIPEPSWEEDFQDPVEFGGLDLIIMPGLVFDKTKARLGHGKGYYDRYLASLEPRPKTLAIALSKQIIDTGIIPICNHDIKPDFLFSSIGDVFLVVFLSKIFLNQL